MVLPGWTWVLIIIFVIVLILILTGALSGSVGVGAFMLPFFSRRSTTDSASGS